ncbi:MAG: stimulus-sensing domain-containing protein [Alphaproteobacteria bacterium]
MEQTRMRLAGVKGPGPERRRRFSTLTLRILMLNVLPLVVLVGGIFYLDQYRDGLLDAKIAAMQSQAEVIAGALGESALVGSEDRRRLERNTAARIIRRLVVPTNTRARLYLPNGGLLADSRELVAAGRQVQLRYLPRPIPRTGSCVSSTEFTTGCCPNCPVARHFHPTGNAWAVA